LKFAVAADVFERNPQLCFGVVVAEGIDNRTEKAEISEILERNVECTRQSFQGTKVKDDPRIACYRNAFRLFGINPNKHRSSIEAMVTRISKGGRLPNINNAVNLANAVSLKHLLPIGTHDVGGLEADMMVRFAGPEDRFVPFGQTEAERPEPGELIYATGTQVKTRRWIWRQSEMGKVTEGSSHIFFPLDGLSGKTDRAVVSAMAEIAQLCARFFQCRVKSGFIDKNNRSVDL
jgi:DNA/RNA-binding domain of Phe-tRNA-synthetase-like protein